MYMDLDDVDQDSWHFVGISSSKDRYILMAYARLRYISEKGFYKIERVVCAKNYRGYGHGKLLIEQILKKSQLLSSNPRLYLSSQLSAVTFYENFGFTKMGKVYDDGGIDHIDMTLNLKTKNSLG